MSETLFLTKLQTLAQMFFCEFCKIFKNTFFAEHLRVTASDIRIQAVIIYNLNLSCNL